MASDAEVDLLVNASNTLRDLERDLDRLVNQAEASADPVLIAATLDRTLAIRELRSQLDDAIRAAQADADDIQVNVRVDDDDTDRISRLGTGLRLLGGAAQDVGRPLAGLAGSLGTAGAAAGSAIPLVAGLVAATESLVPAAAVAVSAFAALKITTATVKVAMIGVQDAIEAAFDPDADPEKLAEALAKLAPEARDFVTSLSDMRGRFDDIRLNIQNILFRNFGDVVDRLGRTALPRLAKTGSLVAEQLNEMGHQAGTAAAEFAESGAFGKVLNSTVISLKNLERVPKQAVTAFGQLASAAAPSLARVTSAAGNAFDRISDKLTSAFESGQLEKAIEAAIDNFAQLGRIAGNIFAGLGNIFEAVAADGQGLFSVVETLSQAFEDLTASKDFQRALQELSKTMALIAKTAAPLLITAFEIIGDIVIAIAPAIQGLVKVLGEALGRVLAALGPVLVTLAEAFAALIPIVTPFVELAGKLLAAILPALIPLFESLAEIFAEIAPFAAQLAANIATQLLPLLNALAKEVLPQLLPPFVELARVLFPALTDILVKIAPSLETMALLFADIVTELAPLIAEVLNLVVALAVELTPIIQPLIDMLIRLMESGLRALADIIRGTVIPALQILTKLLRGDVEGAFQQFRETAARIISETILSFVRFRDRVAAILRDFVLQLPSRMREAMNGLVRSVIEGANQAIEQIKRIPAEFIGSFVGLPGRLFDIGRNILRGLIDGIASQIVHLKNLVSEVGSIVPDTIGSILGIASPSKVMRAMGVDTMDGFRLGLESQLPALARAVESVGLSVPIGVSGGADTRRGSRPEIPNRAPGLRPQPPSFRIQIGNHVLNEYVDYRLAQAERAAHYRNTRGVRI